jgi:hypothetical protein
MDFWTKVAFFLLMGYSLFSRAFAYIGIPPLKIFIGEVTLAAFICFKPRAVFDRWLDGLTRGGEIAAFGWLLLLTLIYGCFETVSGLLAGYKPVTAFENLVFNIYPIYLFLGLWAGLHWPDMLRKYIRYIAWYSTFYGPLYLAYLGKLKLNLPGTDVPIFSQPGGGSDYLVGLLCFEPNPGKFWLPILVSGFMLLAMQIRGEWIGFLCMLAVWGVLGRKIGRLILPIGLIAALLTIGAIADIHLPGAASRGGEISTREVIGRALSAFDPEDAADYSSNSQTYAGTVTWRTTWWKAIRESVVVDVPTFLFGHGYGYPLKDLVSYTRNLDIRTPHSIFYFCLGYSGAVGVLLFFSLQGSIAYLLWRTYRVTGQPFGLAFYSSFMLGALFGNAFETPLAAIPFYLIIGLCVAPLFQAKDAQANDEHPVYAPARTAGDVPIYSGAAPYVHSASRPPRY